MHSSCSSLQLSQQTRCSHSSSTFIVATLTCR
jgi:hypothetical protein